MQTYTHTYTINIYIYMDTPIQNARAILCVHGQNMRVYVCVRKAKWGLWANSFCIYERRKGWKTTWSSHHQCRCRYGRLHRYCTSSYRTIARRFVMLRKCKQSSEIRNWGYLNVLNHHYGIHGGTILKKVKTYEKCYTERESPHLLLRLCERVS